MANDYPYIDEVRVSIEQYREMIRRMEEYERAMREYRNPYLLYEPISPPVVQWTSTSYTSDYPAYSEICTLEDLCIGKKYIPGSKDKYSLKLGCKTLLEFKYLPSIIRPQKTIYKLRDLKYNMYKI